MSAFKTHKLYEQLPWCHRIYAVHIAHVASHLGWHHTPQHCSLPKSAHSSLHTGTGCRSQGKTLVPTVASLRWSQSPGSSARRVVGWRCLRILFARCSFALLLPKSNSWVPDFTQGARHPFLCTGGMFWSPLLDSTGTCGQLCFLLETDSPESLLLQLSEICSVRYPWDIYLGAELRHLNFFYMTFLPELQNLEHAIYLSFNEVPEKMNFFWGNMFSSLDNKNYIFLHSSMSALAATELKTPTFHNKLLQWKIILYSVVAFMLISF